MCGDMCAANSSSAFFLMEPAREVDGLISMRKLDTTKIPIRFFSDALALCRAHLEVAEISCHNLFHLRNSASLGFT